MSHSVARPLRVALWGRFLAGRPAGLLPPSVTVHDATVGGPMSARSVIAGWATGRTRSERSPRMWQVVRGPALVAPPNAYVTLEALVAGDRADGVPCLRQLYLIAPSQMNQLARSYLETQRTLPDEDQQFVEAAIRHATRGSC